MKLWDKIQGRLKQSPRTRSILLYLFFVVISAMFWSFLTFNRSFSMPINQMSQQLNSIVMALAGANRIFALLDEEPEEDKPEPEEESEDEDEQEHAHHAVDAEAYTAHPCTDENQCQDERQLKENQCCSHIQVLRF